MLMPRGTIHPHEDPGVLVQSPGSTLPNRTPMPRTLMPTQTPAPAPEPPERSRQLSVSMERAI